MGNDLENNSDPSSMAMESTEEAQNFADKFGKLEKAIRVMGRDMLDITRGQKDVATVLQTVLSRLDDLELLAKGTSQTVWRAAKETQGQLQSSHDQFAGAIRELEARVREEMQWQLRWSVLEAICPALDDMDLIIATHKLPAKSADGEDGFLEAMILVRRKFSEGLKVIGLEEIAIEEGVTHFDPKLHEAVESDIPDALLGNEDLTPGTIMRVRRAGFGFNGRIMRVPQVLVVR